MSPRLRMLLRDLGRLRGQAIAAAAVVGCGIAVLVGMRATYDSLIQSRDGYYARERLADVWIELKRAPLGVAGEVRAWPEVVGVAARIVRPVVLQLPGVSEPASARFISIDVRQSASINGLRLMRGRWPVATAPREVVASDAFATAIGLGPGDSIEAVLNGRREHLMIVGTALSPEYVYEVSPGQLFPDNRRFGIVWMDVEALAAAFDMVGAFDSLAIALRPGASLPAIRARLDARFRDFGGLGAYGRDELPSNRFLADELDEIRLMTTALPALFTSVAAFLVYVVLARLVGTQRAQIGLLKAFGYDDVAVASHYLGLALAVAALGLTVGLPGGYLLAELLVGLYRQYFHFPALLLSIGAPLVAIAAAVATAAAVAGATAAVRRAARLPPAEAMRPEAPARFHHGKIDAAARLTRLGPMARMTLRILTRRPWRTALSATTIALAVSLLVVGRFAFDAVGEILNVQFGFTERQDVTVTYGEPRAAAATRALERLPGVVRAEGFRAVPVCLRAGHRSKRVAVLGLESDAALRRVVDTSTTALALPIGGLVLGRKLAEILGVGAGDTLELETLEGERVRATVHVARVVDEWLGLGAYMNAAELRRLLHLGDTVSGAYLRADDAAMPALYRALRGLPAVGGVASRAAVRGSIQQAMDRSFASFSLVLSAFASVIVVGVIYNSVRIALAERGRDLATLRVLGFGEREVIGVLLGEQAVVALLALPAGLAIGVGTCALLVPAFDREAFRLPLTIGPTTVVYALATTIAAAAACGYAVARRVRDLELIAVLKSGD